MRYNDARVFHTEKEVMNKKYKKERKRILGYNKEIQMAIKERRIRCTDSMEERNK